jgi:hypothetical protein
MIHTQLPGRRARLCFAACASLALLLAAPGARADQSTIKRPGDHPSYFVELEPHALVAPFHGFRPGIGFRAFANIVDDGFLSKLNDSVAVGGGFDATTKDAWIIAAMQWNFWLSENWSVFGEPGVSVHNGKFDPFTIWAGGRFHFTDKITLTMRAGRPTLTVGVSFLL